MLCLSRNQVRRVDRIAMEQFAIPGLLLMENAGLGAADVLCERLSADQRVTIVCGGGNNGGDGYVMARHLFLKGFPVQVLPVIPFEKLKGDAATNARIVRHLKLPHIELEDLDRLSSSEVLVDALLGTGFCPTSSGPLRPAMEHAIHACNQAHRRGVFVVAVDVPSGLDCDTGMPGKMAVQADMTISFVARKLGFDQPGAAAYVGQVQVVGIGAPPEAIRLAQTQPKV